MEEVNDGTLALKFKSCSMQTNCFPLAIYFTFGSASHGEISSVLCDHLEGWDREGGRETQEGGDMGIYEYI